MAASREEKSTDGPWFPGMPTPKRQLTDEEWERYGAWKRERRAAGQHVDIEQFAEEQARGASQNRVKCPS